jgi:hypothetical protein
LRCGGLGREAGDQQSYGHESGHLHDRHLIAEPSSNPPQRKCAQIVRIIARLKLLQNRRSRDQEKFFARGLRVSCF